MRVAIAATFLICVPIAGNASDEEVDEDFRIGFDAASLPNEHVVSSDDLRVLGALWFAHTPDPCAACIGTCSREDAFTIAELDEFQKKRCRANACANREGAARWLLNRNLRFSVQASASRFDIKNLRFTLRFPIELDWQDKERPGGLGQIGPFQIFIGKPGVEKQPMERGEHRGVLVTAYAKELRGTVFVARSNTMSASDAERSPLRGKELRVDMVARCEAFGVTNIAASARIHGSMVGGRDIDVKSEGESHPWVSAKVVDYRVVADGDDVTSLFDTSKR